MLRHIVVTLQKTQGSLLPQFHLGFSEQEELNALATQNLDQTSHSDPENVINARG